VTHHQKILIAMGANQPAGTMAPKNTLEHAIAMMGEFRLVVVAVSQWYKTPAFPPGAGPDFVNAAVRVETDLDPKDVLAALHRIEDALGRTRQARWEPRVCDLDLIAFGDRVLPDREAVAALMGVGPEVAGAMPAPAELILPHPRMHERGFVLVPICDVAPDWSHPILGQTALALRDQLSDAALAEVEPLDD